MAITFPLAFPTVRVPAQITLTPSQSVARNRSPFSGHTQTYVHAGQWWTASVRYTGKMPEEDAGKITAFLTKLNGQEGTFYMGSVYRSTPKGFARTTPGTPLVRGASQTGNDLIIDGLGSSGTTGYLVPGDFVQIGTGSSSKLHTVLDPVDVVSSGVGTLTLWPKLRSSPANNEAIVVSNAVGVFRLTSNNSIGWSVIPGPFYNIGFEAVEDL